MQMSKIYNLRCEYSVNPVGIGELVPRLSWMINDPRTGARQTAWQIQVDSLRERLLDGDAGLWDSGRINSDQSIFVSYGGLPLVARQRCWWRVRIWDQHGETSAWSEPAFWEMGLLTTDDWHARWIQSAIVGGARTAAPAPYFRRSFNLVGEIKKARLYVTALGLYECHINGMRIGDSFFRPGRTDYQKRLQYDTFDVTSNIRTGENVLGAILGDGWYCGHTGSMDRQRYGDRPALLAQLETTLSDGSILRIVSDESWCWSAGPILENDLLMGEAYDARLELMGWADPGYDERVWQDALLASEPKVELVSPPNPPVRTVVEIRPVAEPAKITQERYIFDLGQNIAGRVRLRGITGGRGHTIRLRYAEMLKRDGELYTENLRSARATDYYTLSGLENRESSWEPRFTYHGFRYVEVSNLPKNFAPTRDTITGVALQSDTSPTGEFSCSEPLLNQLQRNILWSQRGNFVEIPTDCPQRDERQGWTGDAQIFIREACFNMDVAGFFAKWQDDLADAQRGDGAVPGVVPDTGIVHDLRPEFQAHPGDAGPAWSDAIIICPWTIYRCYGDKRILERHYEELKLYLRYLESISANLIRSHFLHNLWGGFGDWLAMDCLGANHLTPTPKDLIGTAYFARVVGYVSDIAHVLGREEESFQYSALRRRITEAFNREFVTPNGRLQGNNQTSYLIALAFDMLPEDKRENALLHLLKCFEWSKWHLSTGFVGTPLVCTTLSRFGRVEEAYRVLLQKTYPGWLYSVLQGATTIWERWNSYSQETGFGPVGMNSFNHYAYGAIGEWMVTTIAGIDLDPEVPAYKRSLIRPRPGGGITSARARLLTPYGNLVTDWHFEDAVFILNVVIPPNTDSTICLPAASVESIQCGGVSVESSAGVRFLFQLPV